MAVKVPVTLSPVDSKKVDAALARIQSQAKGVSFAGGAKSLEKLSRPLGKITGQATEFKKSLDASNARVLAFGASVAVINKLSDAFGALVSNSIKVEASFAKIGVILGGTEQELRQFGNGIFDVARKTATSFDQVAEGALELARQGLGVEESLKRVETSLKLVRVAGIDSQEAVAGLTAAIKGFEGQGLTVAAIADKLAEVDTKFAVSTEDLINGLERASASARVAGVSFDELLGLITTVQERTQRGGAVIGNSFKTIFARLGRTDTLLALQELGISVLDAEGNVRSAVPLFQELAVELDKLGLKSVEAGEIIQRVAGVRQRDILISLVEDLTSGQSQFAKSLQVSAGAAGALDAKNEKLNETLEALINNVKVSGGELAAILGEVGFTDSAKNILETFNRVIGSIRELLQGDGIGSEFAKGIVRGIGGILTGPGLALVTAIFIKLFIDLAKFGVKSLNSLLGINKAAEQQKILQQSVLQTLLQNENIQREILALEGNKVAQEQLLLRIYNQQAAALARVQTAAATVTPRLFRGGFRGGERGVTRRGAGGYIAAEARDVSRGVGGATGGSKVVSIPNFAFGGGKRGTMVANTSEYYVPNYSGGGDAIFNRDMVKTMGLPSGAKKLNAAAGYIPNFSIARLTLSEANRKIGGVGFQQRQAEGKLTNDDKAVIAKRDQLQKDQLKPVKLNARQYAYLVPQFNFKSFERLSRPFAIPGAKKGLKYQLKNLSIRGPKIPAAVEKAGDPEDEFLENNIRKSVIEQSVRYGNILSNAVGGGKLSASNLVGDFKSGGTRGAFGALRGAVGAAFEVATAKALGIKQAAPGKNKADFDIEGKNDKLGTLFGAQGRKSIGDFKVSDSRDNKISFAKKIALRTDKLVRGAMGYIPNFAALEDAIQREQEAGVPINQIRVNQSGKLRNAQNPGGLAVTNTRDEPTGRIPNYAKGDAPLSVEKLGTNALLASTLLYGLSSAFGNAESSLGQFISKLTLSLSALSTLALFGPQIGNLSGTLLSFGGAIKTGGVGPLLKFGRTSTTLLKFGKVLGPLSTVFGTLLRFAGPIGIAFSVLIPIISMVSDKFDLFGKKAAAAAKAQEEFANRIKSLPATEKEAEEREITERLGAAKTERKQLEAELEGMGYFGSRGPQGLIGSTKQKERREEIESRLGVLRGGGEVEGSIASLAQQQAGVRRSILDDPTTGRGGEAKALAGITLAPEGLVEVRNVFGQLSADNQAATNTERLKLAEEGVGGFTNQSDKAANTVLEKRAKLEGEINQSRIDALKTLAEQTVQESKLEGIESKKLSELLGQVTAQTDITKFAEDLNNITGLEASQRKKITLKAEELSNQFANQETILRDNLAVENTITAEKAIQADKVKNANRALNLQTLTLQKNATLEKINSDARKAGFELQLEKGGLNPQQERNIKFELQEIELKERLSDATDEQRKAEILRNAERDKTGDQFDQQALDKANADLEIANKRLEVTKEQIEAEKKLNEERRAETGFDRGVRKLNEDIAKFGDQLGEQIPGKFADNLGQAMSDALSGAKDLDEALSDAGRNFLGFVRDAFLQQAAAQTASGASGLFKTVFGAVAGSVLGSFGQTANQAYASSGLGGPMRFGTPNSTTSASAFMRDATSSNYYSSFRGGIIKGFNRGGAVGSDVVPAMLTPGEFIMSRDAVNKYGLQMLTRMNEGVTSMATMQNGGLISPAAAPVGGDSSQVNNNSEFTFNIQGGNTEQEQGSQQESMQDREFAKRIRSAVTQVVSEESRRGGSLAYLYTQ